LSFGGVAYYRWFRQAHDDGNIADAIRCGDAEDPPDDADPDDLCLEEEGEVETARNEEGESFNLVDSGAGDLNFGVIDRTAQSADSYGFALQAVERAPLLGLPNQFLIGASYDHGKVEYTTSSELGFFLPRFAVSGLAQEGLTDEPFILDEPDDFRPRDITTENDYVGVYFVNAIDLTRQLALTVGGRYNWARLDLKNNAFDPPEECEEEPDEEGCEDKLTGTHNFERFNPMVGATYQVLPGLTLFGSYAEANRAPTAAELACADPEAPCLIESFLTADPPLEQVVSKTYELGLRGRLASWDGDKRLEWTAGLFHATNEDDIITVASETNGRGFFQNAGETQRQGVEASLAYRDSKWYAYANYSFVDATFRNALLLASPDHPNDEVTVNCLDPGEPAGEDDPRCIQVESGDRLPGIPRHKFKAGFDYRITSKWRFGADLIAAGHQVFFGDESNDAKPLSGYAKVDLHTSYDISDNIQVYGLIDNLFDSRYGLFGNFFGVDAANEGAEADGLGHDFFQEGNNRTITPAPPFAIYGGVRMRF
jgi:outer membrane receptor protein involved in Fe transport